MSYLTPVISLISGALGAFFIVKAGRHIGLTDYPDGRSSHITPVPKGGGIGILLAFFICAVMLDLGFLIWFPAVCISLISFVYGDRHEISPNLRLIVQFLSAGLFLSGIYFYYKSPVVTFITFLPFVVFIAGTANFYNFMDGINGIAAISGSIAFGFLVIWGLLFDGDGSLVVLALCISFSLIGFLPFNVPTARVFMGDVGSILLGFLFSGFVIMFSGNMLDFLCLSGFLLPFYADELSTMVIRISQGESLKKPHRKHLYQILVNEMSMPHVSVSICYGIFQVVISAFLLFARYFGVFPVMIVLFTNFLGFFLISFHFRRKILCQEAPN